MTKVAILLKTVRLEKGYEIAEVSKKIKIPFKYLLAFEDGDCSKYPNEPYCSLSVKEYAEFLGLDGQEILRLFRRDYIQKKSGANTIMKNVGLTPKTTFTIAIIFMICLFTFYLLNEYLKYNRSPELQVDWPKIITSQSVEINGKTNPDATVRINQDLVIVNSDGNFSRSVILQSTGSKITVESKSPNGKTTMEQKTLVKPTN